MASLLLYRKWAMLPITHLRISYLVLACVCCMHIFLCMYVHVRVWACTCLRLTSGVPLGHVNLGHGGGVPHWLQSWPTAANLAGWLAPGNPVATSLVTKLQAGCHTPAARLWAPGNPVWVVYRSSPSPPPYFTRRGLSLSLALEI